MENATEAFMMAFGVFTLVIALSISISLLGQVNNCSKSILKNIDSNNSYLYVENPQLERVVGIDTIIPTIYRTYDENIRVEFYNSDGTPFPVYELTDTEHTKINFIGITKNKEEKDIGSLDKNELFKDLIYGFSGTEEKNNYSNLGIKLYRANRNNSEKLHVYMKD